MYKKSALTAGSERVRLNASAICSYTNKIHLDCWGTWRRRCVKVHQPRQLFDTSRFKRVQECVTAGSTAAHITIIIHSEIWMKFSEGPFSVYSVKCVFLILWAFCEACHFSLWLPPSPLLQPSSSPMQSDRPLNTVGLHCIQLLHPLSVSHIHTQALQCTL